MISKKLLVTGLVLTLMASGGSVYASQECLVSTVSGETAVVSEVGKPYAIIGDTRFEYVPGKVTVDELSAYFKSLKVVDSGGNDLGMSDQLVSLDAKCLARTLELEVAYLNEADGIAGSKGFIVGLVDYSYVALMVNCMPISESESSFPVINIADGGFHFYKGQTITAEDLLSKISVVDSSGKENDELKKSILFDSIHLSNPDPLWRLSAEEVAAFINKTIASCGYENLKEDFFYIGVYVDDSNYKTADVFAARAYFDAGGSGGEPKLISYLGKDSSGNYYRYSVTEFNNSYLAYQIKPSLPAAKMYQQFLNSKCKIVGLEDQAKGYMDYNATASASLKAQMMEQAFDINVYFASSAAKLYEETVDHVKIVDKDGNVS